MRNLKYAILGLLLKKEMSGYDISQQFDTTLCEFWSAKHSQIYPELKRLTSEGSIEYKVEISGKILKKKVYSITDKGKDEFHSWMGRHSKIMPVPKDAFRLKMFFINSLEPDKRIDILKNQLEQYQKRLEHFKEVQNRFKTVPLQNSDEAGEYLILKSSVLRAEMVCAWLEECINFFSE